MENSFINTKTYNNFYPNETNLKISILMNNSVENLYPLNRNLIKRNIKINRLCKTLYKNDQNRTKNSIITKRLSLEGLNKKNLQKNTLFTHFSNLGNMLNRLSYNNNSIFKYNQKRLINNIILIQRNVKKFFKNKKGNIKPIKKISFSSEKDKIRKKGTIKSIKINFCSNSYFYRTIPQRTKNYIIKKIIVNKKIQLKKIIIIQRAYRKFIKNNNISFIKNLRKIFQDCKNINDGNYINLPKCIDKYGKIKKTFNKKKLLLKNNNNNNTLFFSINQNNSSLANKNKININTTIEIEMHNSNKSNDINDYLLRKTFSKDFNSINCKNICKTQKRKLNKSIYNLNINQINSIPKKFQQKINYTYVKKNSNSDSIRNENKKKLSDSFSIRNKNLLFYNKKITKFIKKEHNYKKSDNLIKNNPLLKYKINAKNKLSFLAKSKKNINNNKAIFFNDFVNNDDISDLGILKKYFINDSRIENRLILRNNQIIGKSSLILKKP